MIKRNERPRATGFNPGYCGKSMSVRAKEAYERDEKPISYWDKYKIVSRIELHRPEIAPACKKLLLSELKEMFLCYSGWHHTGEYFRQTDFYKIDYQRVDLITEEEILACVSNRKKRKQEEKLQKSNVNNLRINEEKCGQTTKSATILKENTNGKLSNSI